MTCSFSLTVFFCTLILIVDHIAAEAITHAKKPAVILVPAAFSKASVYNQVKLCLSHEGYDVIAVNLPSVGKGAAKVNRIPDIEAVQKSLKQQIQNGKDVILVGNSYGGTVICDAVGDFEAKSSIKFTGKGKILGLIFFSGFLPYMSELSNAHPDIRSISPSWFRFEGTSRVFWDGDLTNLPPSHTLYNLLPLDQAAQYSKRLQPSSFAALNATAKYIPYNGNFRSLYVVGSNDNAVPPALAKTYFEQPGAKWETLTIDGDHSPMLSRPDEFVKIVRRFAGERV
ncbi:Alpha/Beta hydrolase protein [Phaeosphaeria sp. MPI-PUGE-AT-0046c]|nr:Alpha/Beta hydrolase protein [Phaeosphaeria sp. MPI-PUGE-AT-0046c]